MENQNQFHRALTELERAAEITSSPNVSTQERAAAEEVILSFRKSKDSIDFCKFILERTQSEHLRYDTAQVLRDNLLAGWERIGKTEVPTILAQQLINLLFNSNISYAVGRRLGSVIALIVKHQAIERNGQERKELVHHLISILASSGHPFMVATTILESIIAEHQFVSVSVKTDHVFTFEAHFASKKNFENAELLLIFEGCLQFLSNYSSGRENEFERILRLVEIVMFWCFTNTHLPQRILVVIENDLSPVFKPPTTWERVVTNSAFETIFFDLHLRVRGSENLVPRTMQLLNQIFSMSGPLFPGRAARAALLARLLPQFVHLLEMPNKLEREILGLSDIVRKVLLFHRMATLNSIERNVLENFFCVVGNFTCSVIQASVVEESKRCVEDRVLRESSTRLLEAWTNVLAEPEVLPNCILPISKLIFNTYLHGKLAPPLGFRPFGEEEEDDDDEEATDDIRFRDQLQTLGLFGRAGVHESLDLLTTIISQLLVKFDSLLVSSVGNAGEIFEDLHWAILIAGHFLAYETEGETNLIPKEMVQFSLLSNSDPHLSIVCVENGLNLRPLHDGKVDPTIKLISLLLSLGEYERRMMNGGLAESLSPEVAKNILWILGRIAGVYYLYAESQYADMSAAFRAVWGKDSPVSVTFLNFLLNTIRLHLENGGEVSVQTVTVDLLAALTNSEDKARRALASPEFPPLVYFINSVGPERRHLPCHIYQKALKSLMVVGNFSATEYWDQIINPLCLRFSNFMSISPSEKHREDARLELTFVLCGYMGIVCSADCRVAVDLFQRLVPLRLHISSILSAYYNYTDIVQLCITFITELSKRFLSFLILDQAIEIYNEAVNVTKAYAHHAFGRISNEKNAEDDKILDLIALCDMITGLLTKDLFDLSPDVNDDGTARDPPRVTGTSVAINCLAVILPLLTKDLFTYPELCDKYFRLIAYLSELDAQSIFSMNPFVFNHLLETISLAFQSSNHDSFMHCCDVITCLANYVSKNNMQGSENSEPVKAFLPVFFHMVLTTTISKDALPAISAVMFALISVYREAYEVIAREIITTNGENRVQPLQLAFESLTGGNLNMVAGGDRQSKASFRLRLEQFIYNVRSNIET